jgi:hypothetical protein
MIDSSRRSRNGLVITGGSDGAMAVVDDSDGLVKLQPQQSAPHDSARLYPGMLGAWKWFTQDGRLRPEYQDLPVYKHRNYQ